MAYTAAGYSVEALSDLTSILSTDLIDNVGLLVGAEQCWFQYRASSTATANGVTILSPVDSPTTGRWYRTGLLDIGCSVYRTTDLTVPDGIVPSGSVAFQAERWDTDSMFTTGSNTRITFNTPGKYLVGCSLTWQSNTTGERYGAIYYNGASPLRVMRQDASQVSETEMGMERVWNFATGDYIELKLGQNSGGDLLVYVSDLYSLEFYAQKIG